MRLRRLGRTGLHVSECTIGTAALQGARDTAEASAMLALALGRGVNAIELSAGDTNVVTLLAEVLQRENARHRVHVFARATSLVPFDLPSPHILAQQAYPGAHLRAETEALLKQLGVERLGLQQVHAWCPEWLHDGDALETLARLREEGKIAGVGVSLFDHDTDAGLEVVASGAIDAVQVMVNVFDQGAVAALFPSCEKHEVGVIARSPLYYGALATRMPDFAPDDWRSAYFFDEHRRETEARVRRLAQEREPESSVSDLALRFCVHPAVSTIAVGTRTRAQLEATLRALAQGPLDADKRQSLAGHAWLC